MTPNTHAPCTATCVNAPRPKPYRSAECPALSLASSPHTVLTAPPPPALCQACHAQYSIAISPRCSHPNSDPCVAVCTSTERLMLCYILHLTLPPHPPSAT